MGKLILEKIPWIDAVIRGEVEETLAETVNCIEQRTAFNDIRALCYRSNGTVVANEDKNTFIDLDRLPLPKKNMLKRYVRGCKRVFLETARGCPNACYFCENSNLWGRRRRLKSADRIVEEIIFFKEHIGAKSFFS